MVGGNSNSNAEDYYTDTGKKVADFCIGFFGLIAIWIFFGFFSQIIFLIQGFESFGLPFYLILWLLPLILFIGGPIVAFRMKRRYIGIGIISVLIVSLLLLGACLIIFAGISGFG